MYTSVRPAVVLILTLLAFARAEAQLPGAGRTFMITIPYMVPPGRYEAANPRLLVTTGASQANVTLRYTATGAIDAFTVAANSTVDRRLDTLGAMLPLAEGKFNQSVEVVSTEPVLATLVFDRSFVSEAYQALPDSLLGLEYFAVSSDGATAGSMFTVIAVHDRTRITITPSATTIGGQLRDKSFTIELDRGEVYQVLTDRMNNLADLTGSHIIATKPVGLLSGTPCTVYTIGFPIQGGYNCNPLLEQIPPTDAWGHQFFFSPMYKQTSSVYRLVAQYDNTDISFNGNTFTINAGKFHEIIGGEIYNVRTSKPTLAVQMSTSTATAERSRDSAYGEPSMVTIPPVDHWGNIAFFSVPAIKARIDEPFPPVPWEFHGHVSIDRSQEASVQLDDAAPVWRSRQYLNNNFYGVMELKPGRHKVTAADTFSMIVYGYSSADAISYPSAAIRRLYPFHTGDIKHGACGADYDTTFTLANWTDGTVQIDSVEFMGDLSGSILSPSGLPFSIGPRGTLSVNVRFRGLLFGKNTGSLVLWTTDTELGVRRRAISIVVEIYSDLMILQPVAGTTIDYGGIPSTIPSIDSAIVIYNGGQKPIRVFAVATPPAQILPPATFPMDIPPNNAQKIYVRYTPSPDGSTTLGRVAFHTANCGSDVVVDFVGKRQTGAFIEAGHGGPVRLLCAPKSPDSVEATITNKGDRPLKITAASIVGTAASEFTLLNDPTGASIVPDGSITVLIRYTPNGTGARDGVLRIVSDAVNADTFLLPLDVRNDTIDLRSDSATIDFGSSSACDPVSVRTVWIRNRGTVDVAALEFSTRRPENFVVAPGTINLLRKDDSVEIRIDVQPAAEGDLADSLLVIVPACDDTLSIPLIGRREPPGVKFDRDTLNFGLVGWCDFQRVDSVTLMNVGSGDVRLRLDDIPDPVIFRQRSPIRLPDTIRAGEKVVVKFLFRPPSVGEFIDSMALTLPSCAYPLKLVFKGVYDTTHPDLSSSALSFGAQIVGSTTVRSIWVRNPALGPMRFKFPEIVGSGEFRVIEPVGEFVVPQGDSVEIKIEFAPKDSAHLVEAQGVIGMISPCGDTLTVDLDGKAEETDSGVRLRWANVDGEIGRSVSIDLIAARNTSENESNAVDLTTGLSLNSAMFVPTGVRSAFPGITATLLGSATTGAERTTRIRLIGTFPDSAVVAHVDGVVTLGDASRSDLKFFAPSAVRSGTTIPVPIRDTIGGVLTVTGWCDVGSARLVRSLGLLRMAVYPNRAVDHCMLEFEIVEDGVTTIELSDRRGGKIATLVADDMQVGIYSREIDLSRLSSGFYWLTLRTPTTTLHGRLVIVR